MNSTPLLPPNFYTTGTWEREEDAQNFFRDFITQAGLFQVHREVPGWPVWDRTRKPAHSFRADFLLVPGEKFQNYPIGAIVIEVKRSGENIGPGLNQLLDYMNSIWVLDRGVRITPSLGFLFPANSPGGSIASLMAHQRIGAASYSPRREAIFLYCGPCRVLTISRQGYFKPGTLAFGEKMGAR